MAGSCPASPLHRSPMKALDFRHQSLVLSLLVLITSACSDLPQPFRTGRNLDLPLPATPSILGIGVTPVSGVDNKQSLTLAQYIASSLQERDIPAEAVDSVGRLGFSLETTVVDVSSSSEGNIVHYQWAVVGRSSTEIHYSGSETSIVEGSTPQDRSDENVFGLAAIVAKRVANAIGAPTIPAPNAPTWAGVKVRILPPTSAPGDGALSLPRQLANRFARAGFEPPVETADFTVSVVVAAKAYDSNQQDISIVWTVTDSRDRNLGDVRLDNRIPSGELDGPWGFIAEAIIDASFPGILEIIAMTRAESTTE